MPVQSGHIERSARLQPGQYPVFADGLNVGNFTGIPDNSFGQQKSPHQIFVGAGGAHRDGERTCDPRLGLPVFYPYFQGFLDG